LFGDDDPFDGGSAGSGSAGGGSAGSKSTDSGSGTPLRRVSGNAAGDSSGPNDVGFGEFDGGEGGGASPGFDVDPDEFESSIERTDIGIEGLDEMILGGVPRRSLLSVIGGAGTGKTTFALQFLNEALESDRKGVYITLEQTRESILSTAEEKGWSFREHAEADRLAVVAIDPIEMANSLASIRNDLTRLIAEFDADRLVLDSVSLLEMMYDHPAKRRSEVFGFTRSLKEAGVTTPAYLGGERRTPLRLPPGSSSTSPTRCSCSSTSAVPTSARRASPSRSRKSATRTTLGSRSRTRSPTPGYRCTDRRTSSDERSQAGQSGFTRLC